ncbi:MAG: efflux RND transporter permease subunit [bacterium]
MNIAGLAIKRPVLVVMMVVSIITLGIIGYINLPVDLMPNVEFPTLNVVVAYPGASAEEMETLISKPMEDSFATLEGIDTVSSVSREGVVYVTASFKLGVDVKYAETKVRDKVAALKPTLPKDILEPVIQRFSFTDIPIVFFSVSGKRDQSYIRELIEDTIKPQMEQVEGVASVSIYGGRNKIVKVTVDKALLQAKGLDINTISSAITSRNLNYPVGSIDGQEKDITLRVVGEFLSVDDIGNLPLTSSTGKIIRIKDIGKVEFTLEKETTMLRVDKKPAILFAVFKQSGTNSVKTAEKVNQRVVDLLKELPTDIKINTIIDTTGNIKRSIKGVQENILLGAFLAILIVWLFLGNFRSAIITAVALPNSIIGAFFLINYSGFSINVITLLSLSLAVGLLIDDSIVVRENIFRHIELGMSPKEAAEKGTNEVALAVISTTLSIMAVFIPISFLTGVIGQFFKQFGFTVAFALAISLLDAFTTAPMLSAYWYKKEDNKAKKGFAKFTHELSQKWNKFYDEVNSIYRGVLEWALGRKKLILLSTVGLFIGSFFLLPFIGAGFMTQNNNILNLNFETYPGAPVKKVDSYMEKVEDYIMQQKEVETYYAYAGNNGTNTGTLMISLKPITQRKLSNDEFLQKTRNFIHSQRIDSFANVTTAMGMAGGNSDMSTPLLVNLYGSDLTVLGTLSAQVKKIIQETPGSADTDSTLKPGKPELVLNVDAVKSEKLGVSTYKVGELLRTLIQGSTISKYRKGEKEYDITLEMNEKNKRVADDIKNILITNRMGKKIPLSAICNFNYGSGPVEIRRENKQRIVKVAAALAPGYSVMEVSTKIKERLKKELVMPAGYKYTFGGQSKQFGDLATQMGGAMLLAILFMYMILASLYNSFIQPFILMVSVPLAVIGAFAGLLISGYQLDMFAFIGLLMVLGLVTKNGILLLDFTNKMRDEGMSIRDALLHAAPIRLRPILMTTFAMIFGMLPIALSMGEGAKGNESLAIVVIGGLITSTFLTLLVVPVVYEWVENKLEKRRTFAELCKEDNDKEACAKDEEAKQRKKISQPDKE